MAFPFPLRAARSLATPDMALVAALTLGASLAGAFLKAFPPFNLFGALIIALLLGMALQWPLRRWWTSRPRPAGGGKNGGGDRSAPTKAAAGWIANRLLRAGIILLGFKLNLHILFTQGLTDLPLAAIEVTAVTIGTYALARYLRVSPSLAILTAGGTAICGAAAVMGLSGAISGVEEEEKSQHEVMAVATVAILGTVFALGEIALAPLTGLSAEQLGLWAGLSLHEIAHAVAAGDAVGAVDTATIMKLSRVLMLAPAAILIGLWWSWRQRRPAASGDATSARDANAPTSAGDAASARDASATTNPSAGASPSASSSATTSAGDANASSIPSVGTAKGGRPKVIFPYFMLGFIAASIVGTVAGPYLGAQLLARAVDLGYLLLGMAMAALGLNVNFRAIATSGARGLAAAALASLILAAAALAVAATLG